MESLINEIIENIDTTKLTHKNTLVLANTIINYVQNMNVYHMK